MTDTQRVLERTDFDFLGERREGKVRDIYEMPAGEDGMERLAFVSTDRHSSFDRHLANIPDKGAVLNSASAFWFEKTRDIVPNHVLAVPDPNVTIAKKCEPLPIEMVMRGYLTGSTNTSIWTLYSEGQRDFGSFTLPDGMQKNEPLREVVCTPSTKDKDHDRTVTPHEVVDLGILPRDRYEELEHISRELFVFGQKLALERGLILVDTKYEFGLDEEGTVTLIDEIHTPDSSRWWYADSFEERLAQGKEPDYFDKEFLRLWFKENCDPYNDEVLPEAPPEMIEELSQRYKRLYAQLTGGELHVPDGDITERIKRNLRSYVGE